MSTISIIFLMAALSLDAFAISMAYGTGKIRIPIKSILIINVIGSVILGASLYLGVAFRNVLPNPHLFSASILFVLGSIKIFDSTIKRLIRKTQGERQMAFSLWDINFILTIYANPKKADADSSRCISPKEAVALAIALALDNVAAGFGAGLVANPLLLVGISLFTDPIAIFLGCALGVRLAKTGLDLSWVSGVVLMVLAFAQL